MMRARLLPFVLLVAGIAGGVAPGRSDVETWRQKLEALVPSQPIAYFTLAEDIADVAGTDEEIDLARHLFALAGVLDRDRLARSSALALAELETRPVVRNRLRALAALLDERSAASDQSDEESFTTESILAFGEAMSFHRQGRGSRATEALREGEAMTILETCDHIIPGGTRRFLEDCSLYRSGRRPSVTAPALQRSLKLEEALLAGADRSWSSELVFNTGAPLVEIDPDSLEQIFGVDGTRPVHRDGRWVPLAR